MDAEHLCTLTKVFRAERSSLRKIGNHLNARAQGRLNKQKHMGGWNIYTLAGTVVSEGLEENSSPTTYDPWELGQIPKCLHFLSS